jgi:hypothetical protein
MERGVQIMIMEFSPPYHAIKTPGGFAVINSKGGHEALFSNLGEAEELARMMNEQHYAKTQFMHSREKCNVQDF